MRKNKYLNRNLIKIIKTLCLIYCIVGFFDMQVNASGDTNANSKERTLRVAWFDMPGFYNIDNEGNRSGYGYEYLKRIADYNDWKYEFIPCTLEEGVEKVKSGEIDIAAPIAFSKENTSFFEYSIFTCVESVSAIYVPDSGGRMSNTSDLSLEDMTIGIVENCSKSVDLSSLEEELDFSFQTITYPTSEKARAACFKGEVDGIILSEFDVTEGFHIVKNLNLEPYYFVTGKQKKEIVTEMDSAIQQIKFNDRFFHKVLYEKYIKADGGYPIIFSKDEKNYIEDHPTLKVGFDSTKNPMEHIDKKTGKPTGISIDLTKLISKKCGIEFEFVEPQNLTEGLKMLQQGELDIFPCLINDSSFAKDYNIAQSETYLSSYYVFIGQKGETHTKTKGLTAAINEQHVAMRYNIKDYYPNLELVTYKDIQEGLKMVSNEEIDFVIVNSFMADTALNEYKGKDLALVSMQYNDFPLSLSISTATDPILLSILNKSIAAITQDELNEAIFTYTTGEIYKPTILDRIEENALPILLIVIVVFVIISIVSTNSRKKLNKMAFYDPLTKEINVVKFKIDMLKIIEGGKNKYALVAFDINNFRAVNDMYGYDYGDLLLQKIAKNTKDSLYNGEIFCRGVADKFYLLVICNELEEVQNRFHKFANEIRSVEFEEGKTCKVVLKGGIYLINPGDKNPDTIIDRANVASKSIRALHKSSLMLYDQIMYDEVNYEKSIENTMEAALQENQFQLYLQPKFSLTTKQVVGSESLVRWQHPNKGLLYPGSFIPLFEKNGFIMKMDFAIFEKTCELIKRWEMEGKTLYPISVNLSRWHLMQRDTAEKLTEIVQKYNVLPSYIELELTESMFVDYEKKDINSFIERLHQAGFGISIDDFGSGYSSLSMLAEFTIDVLKLDKSFLNNTLTNEKVKHLVESIIEMAKRLNIDVIAEGVETEEEEQFLKTAGCDIIQGFLFSKAITIEEFEEKYVK